MYETADFSALRAHCNCYCTNEEVYLVTFQLLLRVLLMLVVELFTSRTKQYCCSARVYILAAID